MIYRIDPLRDRRWQAFVEGHPGSSIFHTSSWLEALRRTYGYEPVVFTTASRARQELSDGLVCCELSSWLTGKRLVSLPFSDHCDPLADGASRGAALMEEFCTEQPDQSWRYIEIRPRSELPNLEPFMGPSQAYCFHKIDLSLSTGKLFSGLHKSCVRKKIRRAEREKLVYREGRSLSLLRMFYALHVKTRRRFGVPPQPFAWFRNLAECLGATMQVRLALAGEIPAAGLVTLRFRDTLVAKYSASDERIQHLGGTQWLFWKAIREAKAFGLQELDLGRTDWSNPGLIAFKDRLGAERSFLRYWRYPGFPIQPWPFSILAGPFAWVMVHSPMTMLSIVGRLLYRHFG